jgi:hypothetical protein
MLEIDSEDKVMEKSDNHHDENTIMHLNND